MEIMVVAGTVVASMLAGLGLTKAALMGIFAAMHTTEKDPVA
jgi:hypothetical protein